MIDANKLNQFAGVVAGDLRQTEQAIDQSLSNAGILLTSLVSGRVEAGLPAQTGHQVLVKVSSAIAAAVECREQLVSAHKTLELVGGKLGADWSAGGPLEPKPDDGSISVPILTSAETV